MFLLLTGAVFGINSPCETVSLAGRVVVGDGVGIIVFKALTKRLNADGVVGVKGTWVITEWLNKPVIKSLAVVLGVDVALVTLVGNDR